MKLPKYQTAIEIINEVIVPQIDTNAQDIKAIAKEVVDNAKDFDKKVEEVYNTLEAKEVETEGLFDTHKAGYTKYCDELKSQIERLATQITSDTSTQDIGKIVDELSTKIEALENEESFEYDDQELKDSVTKLNVDFSVFKEKVITSKSVVDEINSKEGIIEASSIKGLIQTLSNISNQGNNSNVKVAAPILEILSSGTSIMQGATRLNFIGSTVAYNNGTIDITNTGGGGAPGGSTAQLQYNNAGAFGGISGATTDGTVVTYTANNLKAADITASGSGGFLIQSNSGTDVVLFGAEDEAEATFYGGVNTEDAVSISKTVTGAFTGLTITNSSTGGGDDAQISFRVANLSTARAIIRAVAPGGSDTELAFYTSNSNATATEKVRINDVGSVGLLTTAPTHTLTLASTGTGIALYNTADQTTNYERARIFYNSNVFTISSLSGGTGIERAIKITTGNSNPSSLSLSRLALPVINLDSGVTSLTGSLATITLAGSASSGNQTAFAINPTWTQTGTAGYTGLLINSTEGSTGSGTKRLLDLQVNSTSKFSIDNNGDFDWVTGSQYLRHGGAQYIGLNAAVGKLELISGLSTGNGSLIYSNPTATSTSLIQKILHLAPTINQTSGTGGYTGILLNVTETTTGSGTKSLILAQVGGVDKFSVANTGIATHTNTTDSASNQVLVLQGDRATPANDDSIYQSFFLSSSTGVQREYARLIVVASDVTNASEDGYFQFQTMLNGSLGNRARLTSTYFEPTSNDGIALGTSARSFSDLFLASGGIINWNNGNATLTHSTGLLTSSVPIVAPKRVVTTTDDSTAVIDVALTDVYQLTAIANNTTFSFTGTPTDGQNFIIRYKDAGVSKTLTWTGFTAIGVTLPTATTAGKWGYVGVTYNSAASQYHVTAVTTEA